jgi:hypothetical protein
MMVFNEGITSPNLATSGFNFVRRRRPRCDYRVSVVTQPLDFKVDAGCTASGSYIFTLGAQCAIGGAPSRRQLTSMALEGRRLS